MKRPRDMQLTWREPLFLLLSLFILGATVVLAATGDHRMAASASQVAPRTTVAPAREAPRGDHRSLLFGRGKPRKVDMDALQSAIELQMLSNEPARWVKDVKEP